MAASDFTNIRIESIDFDQVVLRYTYGGSGNISAWRSTDNSTFTLVVNIPSDYGSYPTMYDGSVASATLYYYKLSDDNGSTFTATYTVKTQTQFAPVDNTPKALDLPVFTNSEQMNAANVDLMRTKIQDWMNGDYAASPRKDCKVCPTDGALILDCAQGCSSFTVAQADIADINSISINCDRLDITFDVPAGTATEICGWPQGRGFGGDECFQAPVSGPVNLTGGLIIDPTKGCQLSAIRYPRYPCGDYTKDCYDRGSLVWNSHWNFSLPPCSPANITGCCSGNISRGTVAGGTGNGVVRSALYDKNNPYQSHPVCGFSLEFANGSQGGLGGSAPWEVEILLKFNIQNSGAPLSGKPVFGCAINVPETATATNFTGLVLLMDYKNQQMILGQYTNANLRTDMPTAIYTNPMSSDVGWILMSNFPSFANHSTFEVYNSAGNATIWTNTDNGYTAPTTTTNIGVGYVWVGNPDPGNHATDILADNFTSTQFFGI